MIEDFAKDHLHARLWRDRKALLWKLDGLSEYDARRPLTATGTNLLGRSRSTTPHKPVEQQHHP